MSSTICSCGKTVVGGMCHTCGNQYDIEQISTFNPSKTIAEIKSFIIQNSSVREFSWWRDYYDFNCAGAEVLQSYAKDVNSHNKQVKEYLKNYTYLELYVLRNKLLEQGEHNLANRILKEIGYTYKEEQEGQQNEIL